jgi:multiple sugar transport system substrate-binding protein
MRKLYLMLVLALVGALLLAACGGGAAPAAPAPAAGGDEAAATEAPAEEAPAAEAAAPSGDRVQVRWFVGLGTGTDPAQQEVQQAVVDEFNASQDEIELILEVVPYAASRDTLSTQIAAGDGPDIIGPVGVGGSNDYAGQYLDLTPLIESTGYDLTQFNEALVDFYNSEEQGQVGLPFAVFPGAVYFQKAMFDEAGLNYPPATYGEPYVMPDGTEVEWSFETLTELAKFLTVDANGNDATMEEFDPTQIVQYGYVPQYQHPNSAGTFFGAGSVVAEDGTAVIPEQWKEAWRWWYDGMWGDQPFIPTNPVYTSPDFGAGNAFDSGKVAMGLTQAWNTCCVTNAGDSWDLAVIPTYNGVVNGRVDADTYRIWKGTPNPEAAFEVLTYLTGPASLDLLPTYGGMPSRAGDVQTFFDIKAEQYPFVENWDVFTQGLAYPDVPSAEANMPNFTEAFARIATFGNLMETTDGLDLDAEIAKLEADLTEIFSRAADQ